MRLLSTLLLSTLLSFLLLTGLLLGLTSQAFAKESITTEQLIKAAGLEQIFTELPKIFQSDLKKIIKSGRKVSPRFKSSWSMAIKKSLSPDDMSKKFNQALTGRFTRSEKFELIAFLHSPLGKELTRLETENQEQQKEIMTRIEAILIEGQKNRERFALYKIIDKAVQGTKSSTDLALNIQLGTQIGLFASGKLQAKGLSLEALSMAIESTRPRMQKAVHKFLLANMIETYKSISLQDMRRYKQFLLSKTGRKFYKIFRNAQDKIIVKSTMRFGATLMELLKETDPI